MKPLVPYSLLAAFAACGMAFGQSATTTPVGYVTETLSPGVFNLVGLTLANPTLAVDSVASVSEDGILGISVSSTSLLEAGVSYTIEVNSGDIAGAVLPVLDFAAGDGFIEIDETAAGAISVGDQLVIRETATIGSIFGTGDDVIIGKGSATTGDLIFIPTGAGFDVYHHTADSVLGSGSWARVGGGGQGAATPIFLTDGLFVEIRGSEPIDLVVVGEVKLTPTIMAVANDVEYFSTVYPVGSTLNSLGLADSPGFLKGSAAAGDLVFLPDTENPGGFRTFNHTTDSVLGSGSWQEVGASGGGSTLVPSAFIVQRRAADPYNIQLAPPDSYSTL